MNRTIVTGVDGSETAREAARTAAGLAMALGGRLHVLSAYGKFTEDTFTSGQEEITFNSVADAERTAAETMRLLRQEFPGVKITSAPSEGKPADALVKAAARLDAALIVVGNRRVQGIGRVLGSIARDVLSEATCDVYVAHTHPR